MKIHKLLVVSVVAAVTAVCNTALAAPATLVQSVTYNSETITMRLTLQNLRGANFEVWSQNATGGYDVVTPVTERSYIGTVDEYPGAVSCGIQLDNGTFKGAVYFDRGATWFTLGTGVVETRALDYNNFTSYQYPAAPTVSAGQGGSTMYAFDLGVDADHDYFNNAGSVAGALEGIEYSVALTRAIYMRDALLRPYLGRVIIRSTLAHDPYTGLTQGTYLDALRNEWNNNQTSADRDVVCGTSPTKIGGGLAWVGVIGTSSAYSVNQANGSGNFDVVFRHELGHNWNCGHFVGGSPEGTGLMGGNAAGRFSGCETYRVLGHRDAKISAGGILDNEGTYTAIELPPYASLDVAEFTQTVTGPLLIDVLANDHDANGQTFSLSGFDSTSGNGGTITQQGQDLVYTAPGSLVGTDWFTYTIADSAGKTATGAVVISVQPDDPLRLYLPLDETSGTATADLSVYGNSGSLAGTDFATATGPGAFGNAPTLDGVDDHLTTSGMQLSSNTVTITAWIKPGATQPDWAGIVFDRSSGAAGLNFGTANELRYHWNNNNWGWNSGLVPTADTWTFVALVVEPNQATIYMNNGSGFTSAINTASHSPETFGTTYIGRDPNSSARSLNGAIDEARVYSYAMNQTQLQAIMDGGAAEAPDPFDGATGVATPLGSWSSAGGATGYEVYLGTSQAAVAAATTASPEYLGSTTGQNWIFDLQPTTAYFWRVDAVKPSTTVTGTVWSFTTGSTVYEHGLVAHWEMNEGSGTTTADSSINSNTGTLNGPAWGTGFDGAGLSFDGVDDSVTLGNGPSLGGQTDFTLSAWIKTSSSSDQVIVQQRNGGFNGQYAFRVSSNGTVNFYLYGNSAEQFNFNTTATVNDGQWHYVVAVRDGANGYIYLDGNPTPAASASGTIRDLNASIGVGIGRDIRDNNRPFNGQIDEVKIYSLAKSGAEVEQAYNDYVGGTNGPPTWNADPVVEANATEDAGYNATLADDASDPDSDPLTFSKVSGPAWLSVASNGTLSGTPVNGDVGLNSWTVEVSDGTAAPVSATLEITVDNTNDPPTFTVDPIVKSDVDENVAYSDSIAGSATDVDAGDTLTYSKVSGPAWLSVASDGSLSGTPGSADVGVNQWTVRVTDGGGLTDDATLEVTVIEAPAGDVTYNAVAENTTTGTASGGIAATTTSNNGYETLTENVTGGKPANRRSQLEHEWTFNVTGGIAATLRVEAHHTVNSEGDDFIFAYSTDGNNYIDVLTVTKTADDDTEQTAALPASLNGTVYIRVVDADNTQGNSSADSLFVDLLAIDITPLTGPPAAATNPSPANGATGTSLNPTLTWDAAGGADSYDVYFGTSAPGTFQGNQATTSFAPGTLAASTTYFWRIDPVNGNGTTTGTVWSFTTGAGGSSTLFSDDFEDGNVNGWTTSGSVSANTTGASTGVYGARLRNAASMTVTVDTSGVGSVDLEYDRRTSNYDGGETLTVEWSADGNNWNTVESTSATSWGTTSVTLPGGAAGQAALQIRFVTNANRNNENAYVDNVTVSGS